MRTRQKSGTDRIALAVYTDNVLPRVGQKVAHWGPDQFPVLKDRLHNRKIGYGPVKNEQLVRTRVYSGFGPKT